MEEATYEDRFSVFGRRIRRGARAVRWCGKTALGVSRKILIETRWRLGDEIMALPIFESLRAKYPADHLAVLTNFPELFENQPFVDAVNDVPAPVDRYVLLRGADRRVFRLEAYARRAGVCMPTSRPHLFYTDWSAPQLADLPSGDGPLIALAAGATWPTKRWRTDRWRALGQALLSRGCRAVELGRDHPPIGIGRSLVDKTTVREAACVLHRADLLVCCDSGLMDLALAANTPVVALFGPTDPDILIRNEPLFLAIESGMECCGHWNHSAGAPSPGVCPWNHDCCLDTITVDDVMSGIGQRIVFPR